MKKATNLSLRAKRRFERWRLPRLALVSLAMTMIMCSFSAFAGVLPYITVTAEGIDSDGYINPDYAFCINAAKGHVKEGNDKSIGLNWSKIDGAKSYAIIAVDPDVPTKFDDAGKEGKTISAKLPRRNFYHWVLFDIPSTKTMIPALADSQAIVKHGKSQIETPYGVRGVNDYAPYFANNPERKGIYAGYDGPCPPWNDELIHNYHFEVFALNVESLGLSGEVNGEKAVAEIAKHIIAQGEVIGKYTLNPNLVK